MQGHNGLAILGPELEASSYLDDEGFPLSARKMVMLYSYIDHFMEKGVRKEETDKRLFDKFTKLLSNEYGCYLAYCCVPELQKEWQENYTPLLSDFQPNRMLSRFLDVIRNKPPTRRPPQNPFTIAMWREIQALVLTDQSLQWVTWHHPDSAAVATQQRQPVNVFGAKPLTPLAPRKEVQPPLFSAAIQQLESEGLPPTLSQPASREPSEVYSAADPWHFSEEEHDDRTRGSHSKHLTELSGTQPRFGAFKSSRKVSRIFPPQATSDSEDTDSSARDAEFDSVRVYILESIVNDLLIEKELRTLEEQDGPSSGVTSARDPYPGDIVVPRDQRDQQGSESRQIHAPPQNTEPARGGIARHTGNFGMPWIPRTDTGPVQGAFATQYPRLNSVWGLETAGTSRQDHGSTISRQGSRTERRGSAFEEAAAPAQRARTPQGMRALNIRRPTPQLPLQDARRYDTRMTSRGYAQGLAVACAADPGVTARGRGNARNTVTPGGGLFQLPGHVEGNQSMGQAMGGQWQGHQEEEQEDGRW